MGKYVLIAKGSPRKMGNSAVLADQVAAGAVAAGADVESIYLHGLSVRPCTACESCQGAMEEDCVVQDDMQPLYPKLRRADVLVFATPVYWFTVSAQMKLFMDRGLYPLNGPEGHALAGKQIAVVLTYGDSDPFASGGINALRTFQDAARFMGAQFAGVVHGSASEPGEIRGKASLMDQAYQLGVRLGRDSSALA